jgi:hypothetical protein
VQFWDIINSKPDPLNIYDYLKRKNYASTKEIITVWRLNKQKSELDYVSYEDLIRFDCN